MDELTSDVGEHCHWLVMLIITRWKKINNITGGICVTMITGKLRVLV